MTRIQGSRLWCGALPLMLSMLAVAVLMKCEAAAGEIDWRDPLIRIEAVMRLERAKITRLAVANPSWSPGYRRELMSSNLNGSPVYITPNFAPNLSGPALQAHKNCAALLRLYNAWKSHYQRAGRRVDTLPTCRQCNGFGLGYGPHNALVYRPGVGLRVVSRVGLHECEGCNATGSSALVRIRTQCQTCNGTHVCQTCRGSRRQTCDECNGTGRYLLDFCPFCGGGKTIPCMSCNETGRCMNCQH